MDRVEHVNPDTGEFVTQSEICIALVTRTGAALEIYKKLLQSNGVQVVHALTISELYQKLPESPISGFVVDVPVIVRATQTERLLLQGIEGIFPNIRVNWSPKAGFRALLCDSNKSGEENLQDFVTRCRSFQPRALRKFERKKLNFNVLIWRDGESRELAGRAFTIDVGRGGCFISTCDPLPAGTIFWFVLLELCPEPFKALVKWEQAWGKSMRVPGVGCQLLDVGKTQAKMIEAALM